MSVLDLKYKNKYLKYKNKYLNLQRQIGGVYDVDVPKASMETIPDDVRHLILNYPNYLSFNKESRQVQDENINISLKRKLKKMTADGLYVEEITLDKLFSGNDEAIIIKEPLNNNEIYLLAKLLVDNIRNKTEIKPLYLGPIILKNLILALNEPTKTLLLSTKKQNQNIDSNTIFVYLIDKNDDMINLQLRFIFYCIDIIKRQGDIILNTSTDIYINLEKTFNTIITGLKQNIPLKILILRKIGNEKAKALAGVLEENTTLTTLDLNDNNIYDKGSIAVLAEAIGKNKTLTTLYFGHNIFGNKGVIALAQALKTNKTLTTLNISYNKFDVEGANALAEALKTNRTMMTLEIEHNNIGDEGTEALVEALKTNNILMTLNLSDNTIGDKGANALVEVLKTNNILKTLNLGNNTIGDEATKALVDTKLTKLYLYNNNISSEGAIALAEVLGKNKLLRTLDIGGNYNMGLEGIKAFAKALITNTTLTELNLSDNKISDEGGKALAEALKINTTLTTLIILKNFISNEGAKAIAEVLKTNTTLTKIDLGENHIGVEGVDALVNALKRNTTLTTLILYDNNQIPFDYFFGRDKGVIIK